MVPAPSMAQVTLARLRKSFGDQEIVKGVTLEVGAGEFLVMVGPSGCGKTTLLRLIAGLESADQGDVLIDGRRVNDVPPRDRDVAMVFQSYALYPHMSVRENLEFGLTLRKLPRAEIDARVKEAAELLEIAALLDRKPKALSGGQRQRVAMGRAIVRRPKIFLFDEPLSNLDTSLRVQMRGELARLHRRLARR
jgi:multiple sugar transport system ATP-binding protein